MTLDTDTKKGGGKEKKACKKRSKPQKNSFWELNIGIKGSCPGQTLQVNPQMTLTQAACTKAMFFQHSFMWHLLLSRCGKQRAFLKPSWCAYGIFAQCLGSASLLFNYDIAHLHLRIRSTKSKDHPSWFLGLSLCVRAHVFNCWMGQTETLLSKFRAAWEQ